MLHVAQPVFVAGGTEILRYAPAAVRLPSTMIATSTTVEAVVDADCTLPSVARYTTLLAGSVIDVERPGTTVKPVPGGTFSEVRPNADVAAGPVVPESPCGPVAPCGPCNPTGP